MAKTSGRIRGGEAGGNAVNKTLAGIESSIRAKSYESMAVVNEKGKQILFIKGGKSSVSANAAQEELLRGNIVTHNHPRLSSFSSKDLKTMVAHNVKEMRVVTRDYTFSMKRPKSGWGKDERAVVYAINEAHWKTLSKLETYVITYRGDKKQALARANAIHSHLMSKQLAKTLGWNYTKTKIK